MGRCTKEEKIEIARELAVALAPYLWERTWGFGLNLYFEDVHVDYRELNSYLFSADDADEEAKVREHFDEACIEYGESKDPKYLAFREFTAMDEGIEMYVSCEQEIFEQIYLNLWDGQPGGQGMVEAISDTLQKHRMIWDLEDYSIVIYDDEEV